MTQSEGADDVLSSLPHTALPADGRQRERILPFVAQRPTPTHHTQSPLRESQAVRRNFDRDIATSLPQSTKKHQPCKPLDPSPQPSPRLPHGKQQMQFYGGRSSWTTMKSDESSHRLNQRQKSQSLLVVFQGRSS